MSDIQTTIEPVQEEGVDTEPRLNISCSIIATNDVYYNSTVSLPEGASPAAIAQALVDVARSTAGLLDSEVAAAFP
jgi:hypothetical protein